MRSKKKKKNCPRRNKPRGWHVGGRVGPSRINIVNTRLFAGAVVGVRRLRGVRSASVRVRRRRPVHRRRRPRVAHGHRLPRRGRGPTRAVVRGRHGARRRPAVRFRGRRLRLTAHTDRQTTGRRDRSRAVGAGRSVGESLRGARRQRSGCAGAAGLSAHLGHGRRGRRRPAARQEVENRQRTGASRTVILLL